MVEVATKEYQTSSFTPVAEHVGGVTPTLGVALNVVPFTGVVQVAELLGVSEMALGQSSLAGAGGKVPTQISKLDLVAAAEL